MNAVPPRLNRLRSIAFLIMSLFLSSALHAAPGCTPASTNIAAWLPAEGHAYDIIGKRLAVLQGDVTYTAGHVGRAFAFSAAGGRVRVLEHPATDLSRLPRWTVEGWVKPASLSNALQPTIYSEGNRVVTLGIHSGTGRLESWVNNDNTRRLVGTNVLRTNEWSHVALVYEGTRRLLYLNGVLDGSTNTPAITDDNSGAAIGQSTANDATTIFHGAVDELSLYNSALTAAQIAAIHDAGVAGKCFNDSPAPTFAINPPTNRNGFLGGSVTFTALAAGCPDIGYQWLFNGAPLAGGNHIGATSISLTITNLTFANAGSYSLRATSPFGTATSMACQLIVPWCTEPPTNIVASWPADGSALDAVDRHDGAVWGGTTYGPGVAGSAFCFNGIDAYVAVPDAPELSPHNGTNGEMSVEAWVRLDQFPQSDAVTGQNMRTVLAKGSPGQWEYSLRIDTAGVPSFALWNLSASSGASVAGGQILPGFWHHVVATLKKGDTMRLYQDGQLVGTSTNFPTSTGDGNSPLYIGRRGDAQFLKGWVDEAALYSRALTGDEVTALSAAGASGKCSGAPSPAPWFTRQPENQTGYLLLGAGLAAFANGTPRPSYQWSKSNETSWVIMPGQTNSTLAFTNLSEDVEGNYRAVASNLQGSATSESGYLKVVCHDIVCGGGEQFEKGWNGWETDGSIWQAGMQAGRSNGLVATLLDGDYPAYGDERLISPPLDLPELQNTEELQLRFSHWYDYSSYDYGQVQISVLNPTNGAWSDWNNLATFSGYSQVWSRRHIDLGAYAGQRVRLGFRHYATRNCGSCGSEAEGWYLDELQVWRGVPQFHSPEGFELGQGDWSVEEGTWGFGASGSRHVLATALNGTYYAYGDSRAVSPGFNLPALGAGEQLELRFSHWYDYSSYDYGQVQISVLNPTNGAWSGWNNLATFSGYSQVWSRRHIDLGAYAGQRVRLGFRHYATRNCGSCGSEAEGWYLDELEVWRGVPQFHSPERFELGQGDWSVEEGTWGFGASGGRHVLATALNGTYYAYGDSRAVSAGFNLPPLGAGEQLELRFSHWYDYSSYDYGQVQISVLNPTNGAWSDWDNLATFSGYSQVWSRRHIDLGAYAGQRVRLGFRHYATRNCGSCGSEGEGWYLDELEVWRGVPQFHSPEGFELGQGDWSVEEGTWEFGGSGGRQVLATVLNGTYYAYGDSRAVSPPVDLSFTLPGDQLQLCYWETYSYSSFDSGTLQISTYDPATREWGAWMNLREVTGNSGGWNRVCVDLAGFSGRQIRLGFVHHATRNCGSCGSESDGWTIDSIFIKRGNIATAAISDATIGELGSFVYPVTVVGATPDSCVSYQLIDPPKGAMIDPTTGVFSWTPEECQGPGVYNIGIYVVDFCNNEANDLGFVKITVNEVNESPWLLPTEGTAYVGTTNLLTLCSGDPDCPRNPLRYELLAPVPAGATIDANTGVVRWAPTLAQIGSTNLRVRLCDGGSPNYCVTNTLTVGVTTNAFSLEVQQISATAVQFILHGGSTAVDYILQEASELCDCPCQTVWQDVARVTPTTMPYAFEHPIDAAGKYFRVCDATGRR